VLNFEKIEGVGQFRPTPPSPEPGYPLECLEPGQSLTETKVRLINKKIVVEKRVISWGLTPETRFLYHFAVNW
jgi:hypothetical protein